MTIRHIAIIMDGNGRWAKKRLLPRVAGHVRGVRRVKDMVEYCINNQIEYLTLFAFGRENWSRPEEEVSFLMKLLSEQINKEFYKLHDKGVRIRFIGDKARLNPVIVKQINNIQDLTVNNKQLKLNIALDYSGQYDIIQAVNSIIRDNHHEISEEDFEKYLLTYPDPNPDLLIRTSGESRLSNFMLWQSSYSELYFTNKLWPDFTQRDMDIAINWFNKRERRFGLTSEQLEDNKIC